MQFLYNSDHPEVDPLSGLAYDESLKRPVRAPGDFPAVTPIPCTRITTRAYDPLRKEVLLVQNVLVRTPAALGQPQLQYQQSQHTHQSQLTHDGLSTIVGGMELDNNDSFMSSSSSWSSSDDEPSAAQAVPFLDGESRPSDLSAGPPSDEYAYWTQRTIREAIYGRVLVATILRKRRPDELLELLALPATLPAHTNNTIITTNTTQPPPITKIPDWIITEDYCAVKEMSWQHIRKDRDRLAEDPIKEVAAMQYFKTFHHNFCWAKQQQMQLQLQQQLHQQVQQQQQILLLLQQQNHQQHLLQQQHQQLLYSQQQLLQLMQQSPPLLQSLQTPQATTHPPPEALSFNYDPDCFKTNYNSTQSVLSNLSPHIASSPTHTIEAMMEANVMMPLDLLSDERYLYSVMPYCDGGELFQRLDLNEQFHEDEARYWMKQILNGLEHLQHAGMCHRDISLENLLVHKETGALIIDLGMCLRLPFLDDENNTVINAGLNILNPLSNNTLDNHHHVDQQLLLQQQQLQRMQIHQQHHSKVQYSGHPSFDGSTAYTNILGVHQPDTYPLQLHQSTNNTAFNTSTQNTPEPYQTTISHRHARRCLVAPQGTCGKWIYMSPEIVKNKDPFDGFAVDMWAAGVILFLMLTGFPPWERACLTDERFKYMSGGYLVQMLTEWEVGLSSDALDLLQRMLFYDPKDRLCLDQVRSHPWMLRTGATTALGGILSNNTIP